MDQSRIVANRLIKKNWQVFDINKDAANGPDLTIARDGISYRVEIKKAFRSSRAWKVTPIGKSGLTCDLIIIILPNNELIIQPMIDHLKLCSKTGARHITDLVEVNL